MCACVHHGGILCDHSIKSIRLHIITQGGTTSSRKEDRAVDLLLESLSGAWLITGISQQFAMKAKSQALC